MIAAKLLVPEDENDEVAAGTTLWHAVRIVVIADIIMSLDNVIAVAAAANGQMSLLVLGLAISIPMIIAGAALIMLVLDRFPVLIWLGAMLLGWIAGDVIVSDPIDQTLFHNLLNGHITIEATSTILGASHFNLDGDLDGFRGVRARRDRVLIIGTIWRRRKLRDAPGRNLRSRTQRREVRSGLGLWYFATNGHSDGRSELRYRLTVAIAFGGRI